jgi:hypothetical protein
MNLARKNLTMNWVVRERCGELKYWNAVMYLWRESGKETKRRPTGHTKRRKLRGKRRTHQSI